MVRRGLHERAERYVVSGYRGVEAALGPNHWRTRAARARVVRLYETWGKPDVAQSFRVAGRDEIGVNRPPFMEWQIMPPARLMWVSQAYGH